MEMHLSACPFPYPGMTVPHPPSAKLARADLTVVKLGVLALVQVVDLEELQPEVVATVVPVVFRLQRLGSPMVQVV